MLLLSESDVRALVGYRDIGRAADALIPALREWASGQAAALPRVHLEYPPGRGYWDGLFLRMLPAVSPSLGTAGFRVYGAVHTTRSETLLKGRQAAPVGRPELILLYETGRMDLLALISDHWLHVIRTAAPTALAIRSLAPAGAQTVALYGAGRHARGQVSAACVERPVRRVQVFSPSASNREALCREMEQEFQVDFAPVATPEEAARGAQVVLLATNSREPVVRQEWLEQDVLVTSIQPGEISADLVQTARCVVVESKSQALYDDPPREPFASLLKRGALRESELLSLTDVIPVPGASPQGRPDRSVFVSSGSGVWDLAIGTWLYRLALERGMGQELKYLD